jgi:L-cysteine:1D-myo-inositol 2-amino-2-deoxy-alpha-D-glucopyranoside ligase
MTALRVLPPEDFVGAVESIPAISARIETLLDEGLAYSLDDGTGDIYHDVAQAPGFGQESGYDEATMLRYFAERGGDPERPGKRQPLDPLLWRRSRPGEPDWDGASLGTGRPGWHIECACIARTYLGPLVEVQAGGRDLVFPHHEMSESHLRAITGQPSPVLLHAHGGMVAYDGEKMSKSLGNLVLVSRLVAEGIDPMAVRLVLLAHHYRADWEYTDAALTEATGRLERWRAAMSLPSGPEADTLLARVRAALADDLDAPAALAAVDEWAAAALEASGGRDGDVVTGVDGAPDLARRTVDALLGVAV